MKTLLITIILGVIAHAAVGILKVSKTATDFKNHNAQIELAVRGVR